MCYNYYGDSMSKIIYNGEEIDFDGSLEKGDYEFEFLDPENLDDTLELPIIKEDNDEQE